MATRTYIAVVEESSQGGYGVWFPDLPGCVSAGDDLDEACTNAVEALSLHLDGMIEDGQEPPEARSMDQVDKDLDKPAGRFIYSAITAEVEDDGERVNVYLPKSLLTQIKRFGERTGIDNRSTFLRLAARQYLNFERGGETVKIKASRTMSGVRVKPKGKKAEAAS
ncbi:type II toxin-antitoxin system HicB family antitoxin [Brevundimonas sp. Root1279]|uniref:type II toxin-antitoxin system HicB family antitoxin n=1 Tax=Brevundimonas sp. Root1279 TaxID=1736443 RepID=UPI0007022952|nr:type II toxin-antitoxin system HicB family antitoxin [Brevundimonas sp. Root1279]KQW79695.1 hypothetical protein ASC65_14195 [Brevundimonas sp. Root1279]